MAAMPAPSIEPPADPDAAVRARKKRTRRIIIGVVALLMFVSVYSMFTDAQTAATAARRPQRPPEDINWFAPLAGVVFWSLMGLWWWQSRRVKALNRELAPGLIALQQGKLAEAERVMTEVERSYRRSIGAPIAAYSLSLVHVRRGRLAEAEAALTRIERWSGLAGQLDLRLLVSIELARVFALRGNADLARRWLADARARYDRAPGALGQLGELVLIELLVLAREGRHRDVIDGFDEQRAMLESAIPVDRMRLAWVVRAYAAWRESSVREEGTSEPLRARLADRPEEIAPLLSEWPELRAFLEAAA
jgi:hypothetical protein